MKASLERRIDALEERVQPKNAITLIAIQLVSPGNLQPDNNCCEIDDATYWRRADESKAEFEQRMKDIAEDLNKVRGAPIRIILSEHDMDL
jgi:hypothetical protein